MEKTEVIKEHLSKLQELPDKDNDNYKQAPSSCLVYVIYNNSKRNVFFRIIFDIFEFYKTYEQVRYDIRRYIEIENGYIPTKDMMTEDDFFKFFNGLRETNKNRIIEMIEQYIVENI